MRKAAKWSDLPPSRVPDLYLTSLLATFMCIFRHLQIDIWFDVSENYEKILQVFFKNIQIPYQIWNGCFMAFIVSIWTSIGNKDYYWSVLVKSRMGLRGVWGYLKLTIQIMVRVWGGSGGGELVSPFWKKWQYELVYEFFFLASSSHRCRYIWEKTKTFPHDGGFWIIIFWIFE